MDQAVVRETLVGIAGAAVFVAATIAIGVTFTDAPADPDVSGQLLTPTGGHLLVAAIAGFVVLMSLLGVYLAKQ